MLVDLEEQNAIDKVHRENDEFRKDKQRAVQLSEELSQLGKYSASVQRSGDLKKIAKFNKLITQKTVELSVLRQTKVGNTTKSDIEREINESSTISLG